MKSSLANIITSILIINLLYILINNNNDNDNNPTLLFASQLSIKQRPGWAGEKIESIFFHS